MSAFLIADISTDDQNAADKLQADETLFRGNAGTTVEVMKNEAINIIDEPVSQNYSSRIHRKPRSTWSVKEDACLMAALKSQDAIQPLWPHVARVVGNGRTAKQCRDRWLNYLRPGIKKGNWSREEESLLEDMYDAFGPKWIAMATIFRNRTDNDIKNKWNSMRRRAQRKLLEIDSFGELR